MDIQSGCITGDNLNVGYCCRVKPIGGTGDGAQPDRHNRKFVEPGAV